MDEFDVFLDPVARKIALQTLVSIEPVLPNRLSLHANMPLTPVQCIFLKVKVAKSMEHRQFIFITPQDVSNLRTDPKLKIFSMKPPARSNGIVGGPQQQTLNFTSE